MSLATNPSRRKSRKQKNIGVSAIQARLINARNEVKTKIQEDEWESCKERVSAAKAEFGKLLKRTEDFNASEPSTFGQSDSTLRTKDQIQTVTSNSAVVSHSVPAQKNMCVNQTSSEVAMVMETIENMHPIGQDFDIYLNPDMTKRVHHKSEEWERCKERVRLEKLKLSKIFKK